MKLMALFILCFSLHTLKLEGALEYRVIFSGVFQKETAELLKDVSQLHDLTKNLPKTLESLRKRAEEDIPFLIKALRNQAYYHAKIHVELHTSVHPIEVIYHVETGPVYPLAEFNILPKSLKITSQELNITLNQPALPKDILQAENALIDLMKQRGYPLAKIDNREVIADQKHQHILVTIEVDSGLALSFGKTEIIGNDEVNDSFIRKKICWKENDRYNPNQINATIQELEATGLFSSIEIIHSEDPTKEGTLPITIHVLEAKQRSLAFGLGYSTQRQLGIITQWQHRNFWGNGETLRFNTNLSWKQKQEATCSYMIPDFPSRHQDILLKGEFQREDTEGFRSLSFSLSELLEQQLSERTRISIGGTYEYLNNGDSNNNGNFHLLKTPMQWKWSSVEDPLDPLCGATLFFKTVPTTPLGHSQFIYAKNTLTGSAYYPFFSDRRFVVAANMHLGSIFGDGLDNIPPSEKFYAGSENTLRGYQYYTVSPMDEKGDPIGGRSLMTFALEGRWHASEKWGGVLFYDVGNVYASSIPRLNTKVLQSVGGGLRYYTPVGPLRIDIAFPLNRRHRIIDGKVGKYIDPPFQMYFTIGQSF